MLMQQEREDIVEFSKKLIEHGLTKGTGGNISVYDRRQGLVALAPSGLDYYSTKPENIVVMDVDGNIIEETHRPSSEKSMHLQMYKNREECNAVVHCHSMFSGVLACLGWGIPAAHYLIGIAGMDVKCTEYATFGTDKLGENALKAMADRKAVILANHGLLAIGEDLTDAFNRAEETEFCAEMYYRAKCVGEPNILDEEEMKYMVKAFSTYGKVKKDK